MANFTLTQTGQQIQDDLDLLDNNQATSGQVLTADGDGGASWQTPSGGGGGMSNPMTTLGDIIVALPTGIPDRLAKGSANAFLQMDTSGNSPTWREFGEGKTLSVTLSNGGTLLVLGTLNGVYGWHEVILNQTLSKVFGFMWIYGGGGIPMIKINSGKIVETNGTQHDANTDISFLNDGYKFFILTENTAISDWDAD